MNSIRIMSALVLAAAVCLGAAPPARKSRDPEPEPKKVYHRFNVTIATPQPSTEQLRKLLAPLELADVTVSLSEAKFRKWFGKSPAYVLHVICIRSSASYEKVQAAIKDKPGVVKVWPLPAPLKRTVEKLPGTKVKPKP